MRLSEIVFHYVPNVSVLKALSPAPNEAELYNVRPRWDKDQVSFVFCFPVIEGEPERDALVIQTEVRTNEVETLELTIYLRAEPSAETLALAATALRVMSARINRS